jgi:hypothetical protein
MKQMFSFDIASAPSLESGLRGGLTGYATDSPHTGPTKLWLSLCDGRTLRIGVHMHDIGNWDEIGTLYFAIVDVTDAPPLAQLPSSWAHVLAPQKLVYDSDECEAECGLLLTTESGDQLAVVPGAFVYTLAIKAPFAQLPFSPETDLSDYERRPF